MGIRLAIGLVCLSVPLSLESLGSVSLLRGFVCWSVRMPLGATITTPLGRIARLWARTVPSTTLDKIPLTCVFLCAPKA